MAATGQMYDHARWAFGTKKIDLSADSISALLVQSAYTPVFGGAGAHKVLADITNECAGNGYARQVLAACSIQDTPTANGKSVFTSSPVQFTASGAGSIVYRRVVLFHTASGILLCAILMDSTPADVTINASATDTITPDATNGWFYL